MRYARLKPAAFFEAVKTEQAAREWLWRARSGGKAWACPNCTHGKFYEYKTRPDIRECQLCMRRFRVRVVATVMGKGAKAILEHLGLETRAPSLAPARGPPEAEFDW
ncbi:MAG: hypothetical protein ACKVPX_02265, partial [Myxococcaceae bacterium]